MLVKNWPNVLTYSLFLWTQSCFRKGARKGVRNQSYIYTVYNVQIPEDTSVNAAVI